MFLSMPKYLVHTQACPIPDALKYSGHPKDLLQALLSFSLGPAALVHSVRPCEQAAHSEFWQTAQNPISDYKDLFVSRWVYTPSDHASDAFTSSLRGAAEVGVQHPSAG